MYERNAIIIERYFDNLFGYNFKNNIKVNYSLYCELIDASEKYKAITEEEEEIIIEYDIIANRIRDIQKTQESLNKKNIQFQEERNKIFENIDEDANLIQKKLDKINTNISNIDEEIKENASNFTNIVAEFNEKSVIRDKIGKKRRVIEKDYNNKLNETLENFKNIDMNLEKRAKQFIEIDSTEIETEIKNKIQKNGEKEKVPFNEDVIEQAIIVSIDAQKRETDILSNIYEKTNKLFSEIKNNSIKMEKHKKTIIDSKCKLRLISAIKEYIIQFLDNERLAAVNGESEYKKLMEESCKNVNEDLVQINNLYALLIKEITKKATKKSYIDLYNIEYLKDLESKAEEFENQVKKLKLPVTVINPNRWRIDGMKKIYEVFNKCVTKEYNRNLGDFFKYDNEDDSSDEEDSFVDYNTEEQLDTNYNIIKDKNLEEKEEREKDSNEEDNLKSDIDRKIDIILGIQDPEDNNELKNNIADDINREDTLEDDEWDEDIDSLDEDFEDQEIKLDEEDDNEDDEWNEDVEVDEDEENLDENEEEFDEDMGYDDEWEEYEEDDYRESETIEDIEDFEEEADYDIWGNNITKKNRQQKTNHNRKKDDDWGNEYINIENKEKNKKNKFFNKFKR